MASPSTAVGMVARCGVDFVGCFWLCLFSALGACRNVCVLWGAPTFGCRTTSPRRSWLLLLLRCLWFWVDGTCCVCGLTARLVRPRVRAPSNDNSGWVAAKRRHRLSAGDNRVVLDVCGRVGRALRALSNAVDMVARRGVGVAGFLLLLLISTLVNIAACALCWVRRRCSDVAYPLLVVVVAMLLV
jgi:hypothetical protein